MRKKLFLILGIGILLIGSFFAFIDFDNTDNEFILVEKQPFEKDLPELQNKINNKINEYYFEKFGQRRTIFEWE